MPYLGNPAVDRFTSTKAASVYSGDGSTVAFTLEHSVGSDEDILVSVDGVIQEPSVAYAVSSGTTLTFTAAPSSNSGNNIFVYYLFRTIGTVTHPPTSALSATSLNTSGNVVHNEDSADVDFRVESNGNANMLFVDGGNDRVGIGTATPLSKLDVTGGFITVSKDANTAGRVGASEYITGSTANDLIVQATGSTITRFYQSGVNSLNIDAIGAVTKPLQPAFHVKLSSSQTNFAVATTHTISFATEIYDQNADFASNTFTAPVTGKYLLVANMGLLNIDIDATYLFIHIATSNRNYTNIKDFRALDFDATYWSQSVTGIADMDANDTAIVQLRINGGAAQTDLEANEAYTYFSGYLLG